MTSQALIAERPVTAQEFVGAVTSAPANAELSSNQSVLPSPIKVAKLPYQKPQQIELLNLHAEAEALLQQVQRLKQQRIPE
ncbi:hypothetical protein ACQ4M4_02730 [Leptolyngbya sp. AN02str]|uniref:hypothetical protein n=1 Tax=Leptolyngbya sp. AN02str TaxID=3423363 RepID=UPI003D319B78